MKVSAVMFMSSQTSRKRSDETSSRCAPVRIRTSKKTTNFCEIKMKQLTCINDKKISTYNKTETKPKMLETPQKTPQNATIESETPQFPPQNSEPKKSKSKSNSYHVIQQVRGVTLIARQTAKQRVSYQLVIHKDGKRIRKTLFAASERDTQAKAKAVSHFKEISLNLQKGLVNEQTLAAEREDFFVFFEEITRTKKRTTQKAWQNTLVHLKAWRNGKALLFKDIDRPMCHSFRQYLERLLMKNELKANSANVYLAKFKAALNVALEFGVIAFNPAATLKAFASETPNIAFLTLPELQRLATTPPPSIRGYDERELKTYLLFLALTGVRPNDAISFSWNIIQSDFKGGYYIDFRPSKTRSKGVSFHRLYLHADVMRLLSEHRERQINFAPENKIFTNIPPSNSLNAYLRKWCKEAPINKHLTVYGMRHTHASLLLAEGNDLYTISKVLAHTSTRHTERYSHLLDDSKRNAVQSLPSIFRTEPTIFT